VIVLASCWNQFFIGHISGPYPDTIDTDNRAWLAAELYRTTCDATYGQKYVDYIVNAGYVVAMGGNDFTDFGVEAAWAFYYASSCSTEPSSFAQVRTAVRARLLSSAKYYKKDTLSNVYRNAGRMDVPGI
jgi:hypothetical protein